MLTVAEVARRMRRDPETIRRWIQSGRLRARRVGTQHLIDEADLVVVMPAARRSLPMAWRKTATGEPMPDVVGAVRRSSELLQAYGPRVAESGLGLIADYPWTAPYEDLRLKAR